MVKLSTNFSQLEVHYSAQEREIDDVSTYLVPPVTSGENLFPTNETCKKILENGKIQKIRNRENKSTLLSRSGAFTPVSLKEPQADDIKGIPQWNPHRRHRTAQRLQRVQVLAGQEFRVSRCV